MTAPFNYTTVGIACARQEERTSLCTYPSSKLSKEEPSHIHSELGLAKIRLQTDGKYVTSVLQDAWSFVFAKGERCWYGKTHDPLKKISTLFVTKSSATTASIASPFGPILYWKAFAVDVGCTIMDDTQGSTAYQRTSNTVQNQRRNRSFVVIRACGAYASRIMPNCPSRCKHTAGLGYALVFGS